MVKVTNLGKHGFTIVNNIALADSTLSWKAKGILAYMRSRPDDWQFYSSEVAKHSTDGMKSLLAGLRELEDRGYLKRFQEKKQGKFSDLEWQIADTPAFLPQTGFGRAQNRHAENGRAQNGALLNTDGTNTDKPNTDSKDLSPVDTGQRPEPDYAKLVQYLNQRSGKHYRDTPTNRNLIKARFSDGATVDDIKAAIDHVCAGWRGTKMDQYIRPSTIFRASKFEGYVNGVPYAPHEEQQKGDESYGGVEF